MAVLSDWFEEYIDKLWREAAEAPQRFSEWANTPTPVNEDGTVTICIKGRTNDEQTD